VNKGKMMTTTTAAAGRFDSRSHGQGNQHVQRRRLTSLDAKTSTLSEYVVELTLLNCGTAGDLRPQQQQQQQQDGVAGGGQCDKHRLPDVIVNRKPPLPAAARRQPSFGRGLRLPPVKNTQRIAREAPRVFPPPPQRRRRHPLAPRRPMTPPDRNVLRSRAVWPSMASGRPVEDEWTRRAAMMRRRSRLPPLHQTDTVATWH